MVIRRTEEVVALELDREGGWTLFDASDYAFPQA